MSEEISELWAGFSGLFNSGPLLRGDLGTLSSSTLWSPLSSSCSQRAGCPLQPRQDPWGPEDYGALGILRP